MNEHDLRRVLDAEAASVEVSPDALVVIRQRIAARRARWLPRGGAMFAVSTGGLAALATAVAVFAGMGSCTARPDPPPPPAASGPVTSAPASPTPSATPSPAPTPSQPRPAPPGATTSKPALSASVPVYYIGLDRGRPRLYREFHRLAVGDGSAAMKTRAAVTEMLVQQSAYDPDYRASAWPATARVRGVRIAGDAVVVDLTGASQNSVGTEYANQAVQQLIWTATAASGKQKVRILLDGQPVSELWGAVSVAGDLTRGPALQVLAMIWLISPQQGATVGRTFEVHVDGTVFEATVQLRVVQNGTTVVHKVITLSIGAPSRGEGRVTLTLPPGAYTIEAFEYSAEDGSIQHMDNHQITVS